MEGHGKAKKSKFLFEFIILVIRDRFSCNAFMQHLLIILSLLFTSIICSKDIDFNDLQKRDGLFYEKFKEEPFSGKVVGRRRGNIVEGQIEGEWLVYNNGQLWIKSNYKDGKRDGEWVRYYASGQLHIKINYKEGKTDGVYIFFNKNGTLQKKGNFKLGKKDGECFEYYMSGQLRKTQIYKNGKLIETIQH
ncbi:MAG: hypothetical protein CMP36_03905 [Rickettsiales bacterium]|nr:hypothetical protein [Rickettsiales bacterium]OUV78541.1 MAG: hypothetical protein CBC91_04890 [Rickettsiales bacterium TMED131]|tara:strand:- start:1397 stop:1969 length:573 start_codon:yes stop_codon:yes gene_type:complete